MNDSETSPPAEATRIRRATFDDMRSVAELHRLSFFHALPHMPVLHTPEEHLNHYQTTVFPNSEIWISERCGIATGMISFRADWIDHLYVHPGHQASGVGSALLGHAQSLQNSLRLWTFQCNLKARRFYERHGFRVEKETDGMENEEHQPDILYAWSRQSANRQTD